LSLYASDVLEPLLEATATRNAVRDHCARALERLAPKLVHRLREGARHIGGKCMGYPAIWLLQLVLEPRGVPLATIIERSEPALSLSLTTSIVDDLMDGDAPIDEEHVAMLYLLMGRIAFGARRVADARIEHEFLSQALEVCAGPDGPAADDRRGDRIGHFFRMIAAGPALASLQASQASMLIEATGRFGRFCAHLDDWIDLESDRELGETSNVALRMLRKMRKTRAGGRRMKSDEMGTLTRLVEHRLSEELRAVRADLTALRATRASAAIANVAHRVGGCLEQIRKAQATQLQWTARADVRRTIHTR
jgi:hypothetical protein